jgi:hypothetical protein
MMAVPFTLDDAERASDEWGCNCGPGALAAVTGRTLDQIRPLMGDFESKRYTNPTLMLQCLMRVGAPFSWNDPAAIPAYGLLRVQWEGPWTKPGVPPRVAYRHTHWIGIDNRPGKFSSEPGPTAGIFDINAMNSGGWIAYSDWSTVLVPWLLGECEPKASGDWRFTYFVEVERPAAARQVNTIKRPEGS